MSYKKTTWINDSTPVNADNMNKIEEGIEAAHNDISTVRQDLSKLSGNTDTSIEALETSVKDLDERVEKIDLVPMGVISFDDISDPLLAATQALKEAKKFFPDNDVSEYKFVFRERKTGDLYYGTIGNLGTYESAPELLRGVGNPLSDYDEKITELTVNDETRNLEVSDLKERVETIEEDLESPKPSAFVIAEERGMLAAVTIKKTLENVLPEEADVSEIPVYLYDQTTKFLGITTISKEMLNNEGEVFDKVCFLGDIVTKEDVYEVEEATVRYFTEGRELEDQGECDITIGSDGAELGVSHHIKYKVRHSGETITLYSDTNMPVIIALCDEVYSGVLKEGIPLILPKDITEQNEFENLNESRPVVSGEAEKAWVSGCDVIVGFFGDMPKSCVVSPYIDALLNSVESDVENQKPAAYVEVENIESASEAQKILKAVTASGLVPEGMSSQEFPAYVYDRNTKFLYKCSAKEVTAIYTSLIAGGTPEMPEKICYLGDIVSKQYVDVLFQSIIDGNEVAY